MKDILVFAIPLLALAIGLVAVIKLPRRAFGGGRPKVNLEERIQALEQEVGSLRHELSETQERLDFPERLLARAEEPQRLNRSPPPD